MANKIKLNLEASAYKSPDVLINKYSSKELRAEYSRLRSIARKRLERFGASKWAKSSNLYKQYKNLFTALPDIKRERTVARKLVEVAKFLSLETSSVSGFRSARKARITALQERGYDWITEKNFDLFTDFMDYNRALRQGGGFDSERVLELVREVGEKHLDPDQVKDEFEFWIENVGKLSKIPAPPERKGKGWQKFDASAYFREKLGGEG